MEYLALMLAVLTQMKVSAPQRGSEMSHMDAPLLLQSKVSQAYFK